MPARARLVLAACLALAWGPGCAGEGQDAPRPNLLLVVLDDLGYGDLGSFGAAGPATPHIDGLAAQGVRFTRHYAESTCAPSRAALHTGRYAARAGFRPSARGLSPQVQTLAETLREAGYATHLVGKWHLGDLPAASPLRQGFDTWLGFQVPWLAGRPGAEAPSYRDPRLAEGDAAPRTRSGHLTELLAEAGARRIRAGAEGGPWFLDVSFFAPHAPAEPAPEWAARHPDTPAGRHRALVEQVDAAVGRLLDALDASGQAARTLVALVSDNGGEGRELGNNAPLEGWKNSYLEGGVRTPLVLRWPGVLPSGTQVDAPVMIFDLYPTLSAAAGAERPAKLDGRDLSRLARGGDAPGRPLFWEQYGPDRRIPELGRGRYNYSVLSADGRFRLVRKRRGQSALLDLAAGARGASDVGSAQAGEVEALAAAYRRWHEEARVVDTRVERDAAGRWLAGDDFQRVPGDAGFALGLALRPDALPAEPQVIVRQEGVYELRHTREGLHLELSGADLAGPRLAPGACASVVVSAYFHRSTRAPQNEYAVAELFVDGVRVARGQPSLRDERALRFPATAVGHDGRGGARFEGEISTPIVWNERVELAGPDYTPSVADLTRRLCPAGPKLER